ncbi:aromatase/cyclase [Kitasatospora sp. NPDC101447]|uniref:aromatase/cyclase n=1 Tax=Kitasatospora sp. NPDC101447 TaxID=3364102 RepID=UPI0037FE3998
MPAQDIRHTDHRILVSAPAETLYRLVADVGGWPHLFTPTVHAERVDGDDRRERIRIWAFANGEVRTWTSLRELDPAARRVEFRQEVSQAPVASMTGSWAMNPAADGRTEVVLGHTFAAVGDGASDLDWIDRAVDRNSRSELDCLREIAERDPGLDELLLSFDDTVLVRGPRAEAYEFIRRCDLWPERLPHVARLELTEPEDGIQRMVMDTRAPDGTTHTTESVRVCLPDRIVYKQTVLPPIMAAHTGAWTFEETAEGVAATSHHTVVLRAEAVPALLGPDTTLEQARTAVRAALGANSRTTLEHARALVERGASTGPGR